MKWARLASDAGHAAARALVARLARALDEAQRSEAAMRAASFVAVPEPAPGEERP